MSETIKFYAHIEAKAKCPKCGNPIYLNGPTADILCTYCMEELKINKGVPLDLIETPFNELNQASGKDISYDCISYNYIFGQSAPRCPACNEKLDKKLISKGVESEYWNVKCEACGEIIGCGRIPEWIRKKIPAAKIAVNALFGFDKIQNDKKIEISGVVFSCPKCGAGLDVDGKDRIIKCEFCENNVYLPDDLWLRLHPVKKVRRWYVGYTEIRVTQMRIEIEAVKKEREEVKKRLNTIKNELKLLQKDYDDLGIFKKSRKKELKEMIFNKDCERIDIETEYEQLKNKIGRIKEKYDY